MAQQEAVIPAEPAAVERFCDFSNEQTAVARSRAMEFLVSEWPVLDMQCEELATVIKQLPNGECAIDGRPIIKDGCPVPSHRGYFITIDSQTLESVQVYWLSAEN